GVGAAFGGVDPQVDVVGQVGAEPARRGQVLGQPDDPHTEPHPQFPQAAALAEEPVVGRLGGVEGGPQRRGGEVAVGQPLHAAAQVGLDGDPFDVRQAAEPDDRGTVPGPHQPLPPRGEQHRQARAGALPGLVGDPVDEPLQGGAVGAQPLGAVAPLGERAVRAVVVAAGQRPPVQQSQRLGQAHRASYSAISRFTRAEKNSGPTASEWASPPSVSRTGPEPSTTQPRSSSSANSAGKSVRGSEPNRDRYRPGSTPSAWSSDCSRWRRRRSSSSRRNPTSARSKPSGPRET